MGVVQRLNHLVAITSTLQHVQIGELQPQNQHPSSNNRQEVATDKESLRSSASFDTNPTTTTTTTTATTTNNTHNKHLRLAKTPIRVYNDKPEGKTLSKTLEKSTTAMSNNLEWAAQHLQILFPRNEKQTIATTTQDDLEQDLLQASVKYYIYPEDMFLLDQRYYMNNLIGNTLRKSPRINPKQYIEDALWEVQVLSSLLNHTLRTYSEDEATLFVIPVPFSTMYFDDVIKNNRTKLFDHVRMAIEKSAAFQQGKPHVLVSTTFPLFNKHYAFDKGFKRLYHVLKNVTVARPDNLLASHYAYLNKVTPTTNFRGFDKIMASFIPETEYQFSFGLGYEARRLPLIEPSWSKFQNSTYYMFYHIRPTGFYCNSTEFRRAPILNVSSAAALPKSSIGYNIDKKRWTHHYGDSKFCLVIRGDTPHSHALFNAIKVGCIPVVISDWYPFYAPPFPATLDMRDFSIFIGESEFIKNPELALQSLQYVPSEVIKRKLVSLKWAQQVLMMDHPRSLFVPAFVREAMTSFSRPASDLLVVKDIQ